MIAQTYVGTELELFAKATRWKRYVASLVAPFLGPRVLEVGAGIGTTTEALCRQPHHQWHCLEPDAEQLAQIEQRIATDVLPAFCIPREGTLSALGENERYDAILYIDVLEHIERDVAEASHAAEHLSPGGYLIILAPAHQALYAPFDREIGHYRRYSRTSLAAAIPRGMRPKLLRYLDSAGLCASLANRWLLRQSMPTARQIAVWDGFLVPASRLLDPLLWYCLGKSVLGVWQKPYDREREPENRITK